MPSWPAWIETDLALPGGERAAVLGLEPAEAISGGPGDWGRIEAVLARHARGCESRGPLPSGGLAGFFRYDGSFWFGVYPALETAPADSWHGPEDGFSAGPGRSSLSRAEYCAGVERIHEFIRAGDVYQANLARVVECRFEGSARALFGRLRRVSPAPFAALLETPEGTIVSSSPELFLRISGREIVTRPIKGTRPRYRDRLRDEQSAFALIQSPKELAELVMITDLERNDLGRVCEYGSVEVTALARRTAHAQVHHLSSTVTGWLRAGIGPVAAVAACFPGGSITGAPKKRAMEILRELEPRERGIYTGAVGYFGFDGESLFSIAIRVIEVAGGRARFGVGSGITIDSAPGAEYEETEHKAAGMAAALWSAQGAWDDIPVAAPEAGGAVRKE